jgi:hypothetical protein
MCKLPGIAAASLLALAGCGGGGTQPDSQVLQASAALNQEFVLGHGESATVGNLTVEFTTLVHDSRCGMIAGIVCVWEGNAVILVTAIRGANSAVLEFNTSLQFPRSATFDGFVVELLRLDPPPYTGDRTQLPPFDSYEATLRVTRAGA